MSEDAPEVNAEEGPETRQRVSDLFERCAPALRKYFGRRLSNRTEAEDLTQEVFARLLRRAEGALIENSEGYVFQIAANLLTERGRQAANRNELNTTAYGQDWVDGGNDFSPERILLGRDAYRRVVAALQELPERVRVVFILNRFEELSGPEIARRLDISLSSVEKHMMRAIAHLRKRLK